jgi:hypothetical protein
MQQQARCPAPPATAAARARAALPANADQQRQGRRPQRCRRRCVAAAASAYAEPEPVTLFAGSSEHSPDIRVLEIPDTRSYPHQIRGGRILYLDDSSNIHSVHHPNEKGPRATRAYFDVLATLPCFLRPAGAEEDDDSRRPQLVAPDQPIVILGLGAGTVPLLMDGVYPGWFSAGPDAEGADAEAPPTRLVGWELDAAVVDVAREHMGLAPLLDSKALIARVGDALAEPPEEERGKCAGVVVDLFARGRLLPELKDPETWRRIVGARLAPHPGTRAIVNLGAGPLPNMPITPPIADALAALQAMDEAFGSKASGGRGVCAAALQSRTTSNLVAMTGPVPTRQEVNAAAALLSATGAPSELVEAAGRTAWREAGAFVAAGGMSRAGGGGGPPSLPGMGPGGRRAHYGGGPGMGGPAPGRMRF